MTLNKNLRQKKILDILNHEAINSQKDIIHYLKKDGINVTQATISRDLRELHVAQYKNSANLPIYKLMHLYKTSESDDDVLKNGIEDMVVKIKTIEFMIIIKTKEGSGRRLAAIIDQTDLPEILGTVAGHNTIYVATISNEAATKITKYFNYWL